MSRFLCLGVCIVFCLAFGVCAEEDAPLPPESDSAATAPDVAKAKRREARQAYARAYLEAQKINPDTQNLTWQCERSVYILMSAQRSATTVKQYVRGTKAVVTQYPESEKARKAFESVRKHPKHAATLIATATKKKEEFCDLVAEIKNHKNEVDNEIKKYVDVAPSDKKIPHEAADEVIRGAAVVMQVAEKAVAFFDLAVKNATRKWSTFEVASDTIEELKDEVRDAYQLAEEEARLIRISRRDKAKNQPISTDESRMHSASANSAQLNSEVQQ